MSAHDTPVRAVTGTDAEAGHRAATIGWVLMAVLGLGGFVVLTVLMAMHATIPFDAPLMDLAKPYRVDKYAWNVVSESANFPLVAIGLGIVAMLLIAHRRRDAVLVFFVLAAATAGSEGVKQLVHRARPPGSDTVVPGVVYSYPSGHTLEVLTIFGILTILTWRSGVDRWIKVAMLVFTILFVAAVAVARVSINAHYPSDVLGGFLAGMGILGVFALLSRPKPSGE
ncbi:MAG TPA: phosphatase PAP2 family protein [Candidatus Limnocylindrales bacterium]|nr:phosphatase PAP2 family protein [Candidatus Limnocylindrales bacterium]